MSREAEAVRENRILCLCAFLYKKEERPADGLFTFVCPLLAASTDSRTMRDNSGGVIPNAHVLLFWGIKHVFVLQRGRASILVSTSTVISQTVTKTR